MEAKDTIIRLEQIGDIACDFQKEILETGSIGKLGKAIAQVQAEITWNIAIKAGRQEGIREIVEWIKSHSGEIILKIKHLNGMVTSESSTCLMFYKEEYQKEWEIKLE